MESIVNLAAFPALTGMILLVAADRYKDRGRARVDGVWARMSSSSTMPGAEFRFEPAGWPMAVVSNDSQWHVRLVSVDKTPARALAHRVILPGKTLQVQVRDLSAFNLDGYVPIIFRDHRGTLWSRNGRGRLRRLWWKRSD